MRIDKNTNATILARILPVNNNDVRVSVLKDIGWPHAVIAVVGLIIIFLFLGYTFGVIELPGGIKIELQPPPAPLQTPVNTKTVSVISAEEAIRSYYLLIKQQQYASAWEMSAEYCNTKGLTFEEYKFEWERSGTAEIIEPVSIVENNNRATVTITLYYPKLDKKFVMFYELLREPSQGSESFGFWIFITGRVIE